MLANDVIAIAFCLHKESEKQNKKEEQGRHFSAILR